MISIRQLTFGLAALYFSLLFASLLIGRWFWFYPAEIEAQYNKQQQQAYNIQAAFEVQLENVKNRVSQFVNRNNGHNFLLDSKRKNDWENSLSQMHLNIAIITDSQLNISNIQQHEVNFSEDELQHWLNDLISSKQYFLKSAETDIVALENESYNLIIHKIYDQNFNGNGWLIFLQRISDDSMQLMNKLSAINLTTIPLTSDNIANIPSFEEALAEVAQTHQRCIYSKAGIASICTSFTHNDRIPDFINNKLFIVNLLVAFIPLAIYFLLLYLFTYPINQAITLLKSSNTKGTLEPLHIKVPIEVKELVELRDIFNATVKIANDNKKELELISNTDRLTNIANRRAFDIQFEKTWNLICRQERSVALCIVDIDFFKPYNDNYGHIEGDKVLHAVAQALANCAKRADEIVARFGGEEFVILAYIETEEDLIQFSNKLQESINKLALPHGHSAVNDHITISTGITWIQNSGDWLTNFTKEEWLNSSDLALYEAKNNGRQLNIIKIINEQQQFRI